MVTVMIKPGDDTIVKAFKDQFGRDLSQTKTGCAQRFTSGRTDYNPEELRSQGAGFCINGAIDVSRRCWREQVCEVGRLWNDTQKILKGSRRIEVAEAGRYPDLHLTARWCENSKKRYLFSMC